MSLVTRCPSCDTVFRVVNDQLKVSGGWVRCGQCSEVFNALEGLFELDSPSTGTGAPRAPTRTAPQRASAPATASARPGAAPPARAPSPPPPPATRGGSGA
ncbi:zinc-ribbon domain-containing protein, partial [Ideonella livida]